MATNAKPRDMQAGWAIYRSSGYAATLEQVNDTLVKSGFGPVSERSYTHYKKLHRYGYERYIPINVLDVETHQHPIWGVPLRSRYRSRPAVLDAVLVVVTRDGVVLTLSAETTSLSEVEVDVTLDARSARLALEYLGQLEGTGALIALGGSAPDAPRSATIELAGTDPNTGRIALTLSFLSVERQESLAGRVAIAATSARVLCAAPDNNSPAQLVRNLMALLDALDVSRMLADEILSLMNPQGGYALEPLTVERVSMASPIDLIIGLSPPALGAFWLLANRVVKLRKGWKEGDVLDSQADVGHATADKLHADAHKSEAEAKLTTSQAEYVAEVTRTRRIQNTLMESRMSTGPQDVIRVVATLLRQSQIGADTLRELDDSGIERIGELLEHQGKPAFEKLSDGERNILALELDPALNSTLEELDEPAPGTSGSAT